MTLEPLTLDDPGVRRTDVGYEYRFSRQPDDVEREGLRRLLPEADLGAAHEVEGLRGVVFTDDLSDPERREAVEAELLHVLLKVADAQIDALALATTGGQWNNAQDERERWRTLIRASFARLPDELPA